MNITVNQLIPVVDMIARTFGKDCEVVLHDLTQPRNSVVYAVNGHVTGREIGQSFDHLITHVLLSKDFKDDVSANYSFRTGDGTLIRSSTALIKNEDGVAVGAVCINLDTSADIAVLRRLQELYQGFAGLTEQPIETVRQKGPESEEPVERSSKKNGEQFLEPPAEKSKAPKLLGENVVDMADHLIDQIVGGQDVRQIQRDEKVQMVRFMHEKGCSSSKGPLSGWRKSWGFLRLRFTAIWTRSKMFRGNRGKER